VTIQSEIAALESLAEIDAALSVIEQEIQQEREALSQKKVQLSQLETKLAKSKTSVDEMERTRGELVQDARQISLQMDRSREKSGRARTERESNAAQRENEELRKLYRDREVEIQKLTSLLDQARQDMDASGSEREQVMGAIGSTEGETVSKLAQLEQQAAEKRDSRAPFTKALPAAMYRRYEMIRQRLGSAVSHTVDGTCVVCHITLPPMTFQKMRRGGELDQCPSCRRIIYFRASSEAAGSEPANGAS
jgi:predicted  nucleic acid-binding Zn-ribbon protein